MSDIIEKFSTRLEKALAIRNMKPVELHEKTGISESLISKYLSDNAVARTNKLTLISNILNVNPVWLMGYDVPMARNDFRYDIDSEPEHLLSVAEKGEEYHYSNCYTLPLLGIVKAGYNYLASENIIGYVNIDKKLTDLENCFALKVTGDSMQPILYEDDIVIVHKQEDLENGQVGIILIDNEEATIKRILKHNDYIELIAFNSYYPPKRLDKKDKFKIIGKVVEARICKIFE